LHASSSTTSTTPRIQVPRHVARLVAQARCRLLRLRRTSGCLTRRAARHQLLHLRCASGCFDTSRGLSRDSPSTTSPRRASGCFSSSRGLSRDSLSTTSPRAGSSSTTSPMPRVRVPRHVARFVTRLVVDYFDYAVCPGASARRAARHLARRQLLHLHRASCCFSTSCCLLRDSSTTISPRAGSSSTTSPMPRVRVPRHIAWLVTRLVVDYFDYAARPGASVRRAAHRTNRCAARRRLLRLRRAFWCLGTSRGSSRR
jgi:hypothetical protein